MWKNWCKDCDRGRVCDKHREQRRNIQRKFCHERKLAGLCIQCDTPVDKFRSVRCNKHAAEAAARDRKRCAIRAIRKVEMGRVGP